MLDELIIRQLEPNRITGINIVRLGRRVRSALVAARILRVDDLVRLGRHVGVGVLRM